MKLYQLANNYSNLAELLENPELSENADVIAALDEVKEEFDNKAVQVVYAIKNTEHQIDAIDVEIKRLQAMKKVRQNRIEQVKDYLKYNMARTGMTKIACPLFTISYAERSQSAVEIDEDLFLANNLNEDLVSVKISPNKTAIKEALKRGEEVAGARLVNSQVLMIK